ncbi:RNA polymerase sigma factor SigE [Quadrisphaera sp. DSM 44207]|uniref:RNA polymerase sigma factor SigE n=1 Tax=Quadrisphaera sp. DSM 44207 TaxID=1881057 RepID=UPI00087EAE83|nr:RNA polymerase sigma factor SigE [Quadrisphaera sp. DSM 44207]SDQ71540.1 RNA polymerase, sigma 29 subunit, SigE [Quadrisphaera sp. DSM 44207]
MDGRELEQVVQPVDDVPSWEDVVRLHSERVYRLAHRLTGDPHEAEDLTQEVFVRVFRSLADYVPGTFEGWLHRITTNLFLDQVRRRRRVRVDALTEEAAARLPDGEPGPERAFERAHLDLDVQAALDRLPPAFRDVVVLVDVEELSYEEAARVLDVKMGTVRSRLHRARAQLRRELVHLAPPTALRPVPGGRPPQRRPVRAVARPVGGLPGAALPVAG